MYILVVDDDERTNDLICLILAEEGYEAEGATMPLSVLQMVKKREPDLLLMDLSMPYVNGFELIERLHAQHYQTPFIMISGQSSQKAMLRAFELGAEDYIIKPFAFEMLIARVGVALRHQQQLRNPPQTQRICAGPFELFVGELTLAYAGKRIRLNPVEMQLLRELMICADQVVERDYLHTVIWNDVCSAHSAVDVYIHRLRKKLEADVKKPQHIIAVRGSGYKFVA